MIAASTVESTAHHGMIAQGDGHPWARKRGPEAYIVAEHQCFVIVSLPRTGSTYLVDYLDAIDDVRCLSEVFHPNEVMLRHHQPRDPGLSDMALRDSDPLAYLQRLEHDIGDCGWFGFKHFPRHSLKVLRHVCASGRWRKVFLWRENILEQYLSFLLAAAHFGKITWGRVPDAEQVTIPPIMLMEDFHTIERNYIMIEEALTLANPQDVFTLEYGDLGRIDVIRGLLGFLGLPAASIERAVAQTAGQVGAGKLKFERGPEAASRIKNYDEICCLLRHTRYRRWVEKTSVPTFA